MWAAGRAPSVLAAFVAPERSIGGKKALAAYLDGERLEHRAPSIVDALVAAIAEARSLAVLHYESDFELIAAVTGQSQQWIVKRGSVA